MPFSELVNLYYKNICASKKDKLTKIFHFKGKETSPEDSQKLSELGLKDFGEIDIGSNEKAVIFTIQRKKNQNLKQHKYHQQKNNMLKKIMKTGKRYF